MDQIFGVVHHHDAETHVVTHLVVFHPLIDPVEAVALGSGPVMRAGSHVDARMAARLLCYRANGGSIVGIDADKEVIIAVLDGRQIVLQHAADHGVLVPQAVRKRRWDAAAAPAESDGRRPWKAEAAGRKPDQRDKQVIQTADHDPYRQRHEEGRNPVIQQLK